MYCTQCGKKVRSGARFCAHCGASSEAAHLEPVFKNMAGPGEVGPARKRSTRRLALMALVIIVLASAAVGTVLLANSAPDQKTHDVASATSEWTGPTTVPTNPAPTLASATTSLAKDTTSIVSALVDVTLSVTILQTELGNPETLFTYPRSVEAMVPERWVGKVAAYAVAGIVLLAPSGWTTTDSAVGANGSSGLMLHSNSSSAIVGTLEYEQTAGRVVAGWNAAAQYFSWVHDQWRDSGLPDELSDSGMPNEPPELRPGMVTTFASRQIVRYRIAPADSPNGGDINGVASTGIGVDGDGDSFSRLEIVLPLDARDLATAILDFHIAHQSDLYLK